MQNKYPHSASCRMNTFPSFCEPVMAATDSYYLQISIVAQSPSVLLWVFKSSVVVDLTDFCRRKRHCFFVNDTPWKTSILRILLKKAASYRDRSCVQ